MLHVFCEENQEDAAKQTNTKRLQEYGEIGRIVLPILKSILACILTAWRSVL